jgi:hypothetical protein
VYLSRRRLERARVAAGTCRALLVIADAFVYLEKGRAKGKVVVRMVNE